MYAGNGQVIKTEMVEFHINPEGTDVLTAASLTGAGAGTATGSASTAPCPADVRVGGISEATQVRLEVTAQRYVCREASQSRYCSCDTTETLRWYYACHKVDTGSGIKLNTDWTLKWHDVLCCVVSWRHPHAITNARIFNQRQSRTQFTWAHTVTCTLRLSIRNLIKITQD